jgi:hypothetical protein
MTHPAEKHVTETRKRQKAWVEGRARGGKVDRPGKKRADGGSADDEPLSTDFSPDGLRAMYAKTPSPKLIQQDKDRLTRIQKSGNLDELSEKRGGEVKAAWEHVRRAYGGAAERKDGQSVAAEYPGPENMHERLGREHGGRLTMGERKKMPSSEFALPGKGEGSSGKGAGSYPIGDEKHARLALAMDHNASPAERATIERKVHSRYPNIGKG